MPGGRPRGNSGGRPMSSRGRGKTRKCRTKHIPTSDEVMFRNAEIENRKQQIHGSDESDEVNSKKQSNSSDSEFSSQQGNQISQESSDDEVEDEKKSRKTSLIETFNPNRNQQAVEKTGITELSRRQKEQLAKQKRDKEYEALQAAGKTVQAKSDLARLAIIRERREAAAKERELRSKEAELCSKLDKVKLSHLSSKLPVNK